jgi:hypothetical protein
MNAQAKPNAEVISNVRDIVRGVAAVGAVQSGWTEDQAVILARKAEEATVSRLATGVSPDAALSASIVEAELIIAMDLFAKQMAATGDANAAFEAVAAIKNGAAKDDANADKVAAAAAGEFARAMKQGLSPYAALASAFSTGGAVGRLIKATTAK